MVTEALVIGSYLLAVNYYDEYRIRHRFKQILEGCNLYNYLGKTIKIWKYKPTDYGYDLTIELPFGVTMEKINKNIDIFKEGMRLQDIHLNPKENMCIMNCISLQEFQTYQPIPLAPNKVYITNGLNEKIIVDMNEFPGILISGSTGSGKTRALLTILTNLIASSKNVELFLVQLMKSDLKIYEDCEQVKDMATNLEDILRMLKQVQKETIERTQKIDTKQGYYNIEDYNKAHEPKERMKYRYIVIEEFAFLNATKGDNKAEKEMKQKCIKLIEGIARAGRSSGIFLICCLQRPTDDSIPSTIKNLLNVCIAFRLKSAQESQVIITCPDATKLKKREMLIRTDEMVKATSLTIGHDIVMQNIKSSKIKKIPKPIKKKARSSIFEHDSER